MVITVGGLTREYCTTAMLCGSSLMLCLFMPALCLYCFFLVSAVTFITVVRCSLHCIRIGNLPLSE
jgi:hypothetical protein